MSSAIWWLVLGLLLGWLIEWVIDWLYWRRRRQISAPDAQRPQEADAELSRMRGSLASARADNERLQAELNAATALAQQRQAKIGALEEQLSSTRADDERLLAGSEVPRTPVVLSAGDGDAAAANFVAVQPSREHMASPALPAEQGAASRPKTNETRLLQEIEAPAVRRRDPLIDINGIGPAYERKLFDAGVYTFEDLAAMTPERVRAIIAPQRWQEIDSASWIAEARQLAQKKA